MCGSVPELGKVVYVWKGAQRVTISKAARGYIHPSRQALSLCIPVMYDPTETDPKAHELPDIPEAQHSKHNTLFVTHILPSKAQDLITNTRYPLRVNDLGLIWGYACSFRDRDRCDCRNKPSYAHR